MKNSPQRKLNFFIFLHSNAGAHFVSLDFALYDK